MKFLERFFGGKKPEVPSEKQSHGGVAVAVNLRLRIAKRIQDGCSYAVVEIFNYNKQEYGWRDISPRFYSQHSDESIESRANHFLKGCLLQGSDILATRRVVFLECLQRECERNQCLWFFWYVLSMFKYFSTCYVKDESKIEICVDHQLDDIGDEFFNMAYSVCKELNIGEYNDIFSMRLTGTGVPPQERGKDNSAPNGHERFLHVGSDIKNRLSIHWAVDLDRIKIYNDLINYVD